MGMAVAHRGPDDAGCVLLPMSAPRGTVGFAHRRLSTIDLSAARHQSMTAKCSRCRCQELSDLALVYNGELYNHLAFRRELESRGHVFNSNTDSETLLHLYAEYGMGMLSMLNGIFAFAIRDGRVTGPPPSVERGDLFLARDQLGVKPLYYTETKHGFLFASELKTILQDIRLLRAIDRTALHYHLAYLLTSAPLTLVEGIRKTSSRPFTRGARRPHL
jgi:asparagine synthase (glutamine-hydrolysing)